MSGSGPSNRSCSWTGRAAGRRGEPVIASVGMRVRDDGAGIDLGYGEVDRGQYAQAVGIDLFTGGAVLLTARFLADVGGFDERYFLYYEDIDLARRGRERGWRYLVEPGAVVHHAMSSTASTLPGLHRYWQERNRLWWLFRHGSPYQVARGLLLSLLRLAKHPIRSQATAIRDGVAGSALVLARATTAADGHPAARGGALDRALSSGQTSPCITARYWAGNVWDRSCSSATHCRDRAGQHGAPGRVEGGPDALGEGGRVAGRHEHAPPVGEVLRAPAVVRGDHRQADAHRLERGQRSRLRPEAGQHGDVPPSHRLHRVHVTEQAHPPREIGLGRARFERVGVGRLAWAGGRRPARPARSGSRAIASSSTICPFHPTRRAADPTTGGSWTLQRDRLDRPRHAVGPDHDRGEQRSQGTGGGL